jgi:large subunit ribosomal protein L13e
MVRNNHQVPNNHFHKHWAERVRVYLDQAARKRRRSLARKLKAARVFPRPVNGLLRPIVRCPTLKYNRRQRLGRGFTLEELKAAGIPKCEARTIGIAVDYRRRNRDEKAFQINVQRLKIYKSKLILFPRRVKKGKEAKAGAPKREELKKLIQKRDPLPSKRGVRKEKARVPTGSFNSSFILSLSLSLLFCLFPLK